MTVVLCASKVYIFARWFCFRGLVFDCYGEKREGRGQVIPSSEVVVVEMFYTFCCSICIAFYDTF